MKSAVHHILTVRFGGAEGQNRKQNLLMDVNPDVQVP
jgi:hypothetical protein